MTLIARNDLSSSRSSTGITTTTTGGGGWDGVRSKNQRNRESAIDTDSGIWARVVSWCGLVHGSFIGPRAC